MCGWDWNLANFIVQLFVAIGTLGAVVVALFLGLFQKPTLKIEFEQKEPYCRKTIFRLGAHEGLFSRYWIRIKVTNEGRKVAKKCQGKLLSDNSFPPMMLLR
jgi:hypothetical protein